MAISENPYLIADVSVERVTSELRKMAKSGRFGKGIFMLHFYDLLKLILPEVAILDRIDQKDDIRNCHQEGDVLTHTLLVMQEAPQTELVQFAALFHDLGKAVTREVTEDGKVRFINHQLKFSFVLMRKIFLHDDLESTVSMLSL
jgi:poly(A) polymerase